MRNKVIAALAAAGCLLGFQASALAQDLAEHPPFVTTPNYGYRSGPGVGLYNYSGPYNYSRPSMPCDGTYDPYSDICYPFDFHGPTHS